MSTRREFLKQTAATGVAAVAAPIVSAAGVDRTPRWRGARIKSVVRREETVLRYGGIGDAWHMSWAADDHQYASMVEGTGFCESPETWYRTRMWAVSGGAREAEFYDLPGYPIHGDPSWSPKDPLYYGYGTLALDGHLYQFLSTYDRPYLGEKPDPNNLALFDGVKLICSPDTGRTWNNQDGSTPVVWEGWKERSHKNMVFFKEDQQTFSMLSVLQMGKNYEHNRDGYVYVYSPNGQTEGTMNELVMCRVPKTQILNRGAYEFFAGRQFGGGARWSKDIGARTPVHTFPRGWVNKLLHPYSWHPSVVYNAPLGMYMMANWGTGTGPGLDQWSGDKMEDLWFVKPSYLGLWIAQNPWGPWTQIHEETAWMPAGDAHARAFQAQIAPKWIAPDGKSLWLVWSDFQVTDRVAMKRVLEDTQAELNSVKRSAKAFQQYMPYFAFNTQRVDLELA